MAPAPFVCCGCRQSFAVMDLAGDEMTLVCPVEHCRRVVWTREGGLAFLTDRAPAYASGQRFIVDQFRLVDMESGQPEEVLAGPADMLDIMSRDLNADPPRTEAELVDHIRDLIMAARPGCVFQPGRRLVRAGRGSR